MNIINLYNNLIGLRNRLSNDGSGNIYEEDHLLLDEVLDIIEKIMKVNDIKGEINDTTRNRK